MNRFLGTLVLCFALAQGALADLPDKADEIGKHLEFLGYTVQPKDDRLIAKHPKYFNFYLKSFAGGILLTAYFTGSEYAKQHQGEFYALANELNKGSAVARYYVDQDTDLIIEAWYPGGYERVQFGVFIDGFNTVSKQVNGMMDKLRPFLE